MHVSLREELVRISCCQASNERWRVKITETVHIPGPVPVIRRGGMVIRTEHGGTEYCIDEAGLPWRVRRGELRRLAVPIEATAAREVVA